MKRTSIVLRTLGVLVCAVLFVTSLSVTSFAATEFSFTVFSGEEEIEGWYPSFITSWIDSDLMSGFIDAISHSGATIEVTYTGTADISLLLQSGDYGGGQYPWASYSTHTTTTSGGKKVASFSAEKLINAYTAKTHPETGEALSLDNLMNFGIGGEGNVIYSVVVRWKVSGSPSVTFDIDTTYQTIEGWGASYTWYSDWFVRNIHSEEVYDWIFEDCEFNILRFRDLNHVGDEYQDALDGYETYKAFYEAAIERGIDPIVMVTSWGEYDRDLDFVEFVEEDDNGYSYYTLAKDKNGEYMYEELAQFCVESVQLFLDAGIPVDYFSISNETELQGKQQDEQGNAKDEAGFYLGADEDDYHCAYWKAHIAVYEAFQEAFGDDAPEIMGAEVMADTASIMEEYLDPLIEEAADSFTTIAHHLYGSVNTKLSFTAVRETFPDYTIWQTEWYNNDLLGHADTIINELNYENISAYLYWNGVWVEDDGNCLIQVNGWSSSSDVVRRGNHYVMMHFSKFIKAGYKRVETTLNAAYSNATAFVSPEGDKLVLVLVNSSDNDEKLKLKLGDYKIKSGRIYQSIINTDNEEEETELNEYMQDLGSLKYYSIESPANSITTLVMNIYPVSD